MTPYYYPITDSSQVGNVKLRKRLPLPPMDDYFFFFRSKQEVTLYFNKFPIYLDTTAIKPQKAIQVGLAICFIPDFLVIELDPFDLSDSNDWSSGGIVTFFAVDIRYNRNILVTDVIEHKLTQRNFVKVRPRSRRIGTG